MLGNTWKATTTSWPTWWEAPQSDWLLSVCAFIISAQCVLPPSLPWQKWVWWRENDLSSWNTLISACPVNVWIFLMSQDETCGHASLLGRNKSVCGGRGFNPVFPPKHIIMSQNPKRLIYFSCRPKSRQTPGGRRLFSSLPQLKLIGLNPRRFLSRQLAWHVAAEPGTVTALSASLPRLPVSPEGFQGHQPGALHARWRQRHGLPAGRLQQPYGHQADAALEQARPEGVPGLGRTTKSTQGARLQSLHVQCVQIYWHIPTSLLHYQVIHNQSSPTV